MNNDHTASTADFVPTTQNWGMHCPPEGLGELLEDAKDTRMGVVVVTFHEQDMGRPMEVFHDLWVVPSAEHIMEICEGDEEYYGPRSTVFSVPAAEMIANPGQEIYGDSDYDDLNGTAYEVYFTYYQAG